MKKAKKCIASILAVIILSTCLHGTVLAELSDLNEISKVNTSTNDIGFSNAKIIKEIVEKREKNVKHFLKDDGTYEAVMYPMPVHYLDNGVWKDIDNTLKESTDENENSILQNNDNYFIVKFAENSNSNKLISLKKENYEINWNLVGAEKGITSVQNNNEVVINEKLQEEIDNKLEANIEYRNASNDKKAEIKNIILDNERKKTLDKVESVINYNNILSGTDLQYILAGDTLKENIIIKEKLEKTQFTFNLDVKNLIPKVDKDNIITFYGKDDSSKIFSSQAPYMYDAKGAISNNIKVDLIEDKDGYLLVISPDKHSCCKVK